MQLRFLNNQLQYQDSKGAWANVPQAIKIIDLKAADSWVYTIGTNLFIGDGGIFVRYRNVMAIAAEQIGVVKKEIDIQLRAAIFELIDPGRRKDIIFDRDGFVVETRNEKQWLVGFYKSDDDPSFYLIQDAINGLRPKNHCPYYEGHLFSPDYNPVTGEHEAKQTNIGPLADVLNRGYDIIGESGTIEEGLYTESQVRRIFNYGVEAALDPHRANIYYGVVLNEALERELRINPINKKNHYYHIEIHLNQRVEAINFKTGVRPIKGVDVLRISMHPHEFLNTFLSWNLVKSIRVTIDK